MIGIEIPFMIIVGDDLIDKIIDFVQSYIDMTENDSNPIYNSNNIQGLSTNQFDNLKQACIWYKKIFCTLLNF